MQNHGLKCLKHDFGKTLKIYKILKFEIMYPNPTFAVMINKGKIQRIFVSGKFDPTSQTVLPKYDLDAKMSLHFLRMAGISTREIVWISPAENLEKINTTYRLKNDILIDVGQIKGPLEFGENCIAFDHHHQSSTPDDFCSAEQVVNYFSLNLSDDGKRFLQLIHVLDCEPNKAVFGFSNSWMFPMMLVSRLNGEQIFQLSEKVDLSKKLSESELSELGLLQSALSKKKSIEKIKSSLEKGQVIQTIEGEKILVIREYIPSASFGAFEMGFSFSSFTNPTWAINFSERKNYIPDIYNRMKEGVLVRDLMILQNKNITRFSYDSFLQVLEGKP